MSFEDELRDCLDEAATGLTITGSSLGHIEERARARQKRRQITSRGGSVLVLTAVVVAGLMVLQRHPDQTIDTAGSPTTSVVQSGSSADGTDNSGSVDNSGSMDDFAKIVVGAYGPVLPLMFRHSGVTGWRQILAPNPTGAATAYAVQRYDFIGGATVAQTTDSGDWYVDRGTGWQRLAMPESIKVLAIDTHNDTRMVVAGLVEMDKCDHHMVIAVLANGQWSVRPVMTDLPPGIRSVPLTAEVRMTSNTTVLSIVEQLVADPLCLALHLAANNDGMVAGVEVDDIAEAQLVDGGIELTDRFERKSIVSLEQLAAQGSLHAMTQSVFDGLKDLRTTLAVGSGEDSQSESWDITTLWAVNRESAPSVPTAASLGVVTDSVVASYAGQVVLDTRPDATTDAKFRPGVWRQLETTESGENAHFAAVRDGFITAMQSDQSSSDTGKYLDAVRLGDLDIAVRADADATTIFAGDRQWDLSDLCGTDSGWVRLGAVGGTLRLITVIDGEPHLYQLTKPQ